jgi:hypothetical protein
MASRAVLLLFLSSLVAHINAETCYLPDGSSLGDGLRVCDPSAPASACCASGDECTTNGFCKAGNDGDNNWLWRGGCTDKTWESDSCPKHCWDSSTSMDSQPIRKCQSLIFYRRFCSRCQLQGNGMLRGFLLLLIPRWILSTGRTLV